MTTWYAKSGNQGGWWEPLRNHLERVADRAGQNAEPFGGSGPASIAGLLHDLGKYSQRFVDRLHGRESGLDHWSMGAAAALKLYKWEGIPIASAILGHHVGLSSGDAKTVCNELSGLIMHPPDNLTESRIDALLERFVGDGLEAPEKVDGFEIANEPVAGMLDIRMLFSSLVDADAYWSEAHREGDAVVFYRPRPDGPRLDAQTALDCLLKYMDTVRADSSAASYIDDMRDRLFHTCLEAGTSDRGLFTLAAPTGAGKTWAMMAFALQHAARHGLQRIIAVIPYLSIIEQTVRQYRHLFAPSFGEHFLIEDHSMACVARSKSRIDQASSVNDEQQPSRQIARLLAENWDAPLVITTSVKCLESLFANRPSACRKLHNMTQSVILFDEVQTLPTSLAVPTLAALSRLVERYGSSVVFSTATQPAFNHLDGAVKKWCAAGWKPHELAAKVDLFATIRSKPRFRIDWRLDQPMGWNQLVDELALPGNTQVLCIVNLKEHAKLVATLLKKWGACGVMHVSTNMCPAHRQRVLEEVGRRLKPHCFEPCRLISTQCVEAGVDIDFPVAFRALGPLESIAQAAGRCNRGATRPMGRMVVFVPEDERYPPGEYAQAASASKLFLSGLSEDDRRRVLDSPDLLRRYYVDLYSLTKAEQPDTDQARELREAINSLDFIRTAECYRLIKTDAVNVLVPFERAAFDMLLRRYESEGRLTRQWLIDARPHTVGLFRPKAHDAGWTCLRPLSFSRTEVPDDLTAEWFYLDEGQEPGRLYDSDLLGLKELQDTWIA